MHENDWKVCRLRGALELDIHLIDDHIAGFEAFAEDVLEVAPAGALGSDSPATDEEAPLALKHKRLWRGLDVGEGLR